jgi:hypothetical protein
MIHEDDDKYLPTEYFYDARKFEQLESVKQSALQQYIVRNHCDSNQNQWVIKSIDSSSLGQVVVTLVDLDEKKADQHIVFFEHLLL